MPILLLKCQQLYYISSCLHIREIAMKYRLGLDLGVGSIGSAVIELDNENNAKDIIDAGVRIFEVSEGAEERRLKRTARKNLVRTKKRLELLAKKLFENGLWPNENPEGTDKLKSKSPYKIRTDALNEKLASPYYVGRAILHIAKHRGAGFVSASEETEEEILEEGEKSKAKKSSYDMMQHHLKETNSRTIGEFFYNKIISGKGNDKTVRQKKYAIEKNIVDYAIPRYLVKDEFNKIWDKQAEFYPQMKKENLKKEIYDILFYERPAAPYATGKCIYFREEDRLLKAHPLSEMRRIYEEVNNIRILNDMNKRKLTLEERDSIVNELLLKGQNAGKQAIKKLLNLSAQHKISLVDDRVIKAYLYSRPEFANNEHLRNMNENELSSFIGFLAEPKMSKDKNARLYNEDALIEYLKPILKIDDEKEIGNLLTKLPKGREMLGISATKIILEKLKEDVVTHREITDKLAETDKRFMAEEEIARQNQGKCFQLPYYGEILQTDTAPLPPLMINNNKSLNPDEIKWGKIANPAVHMILNQIRQVVNEIIKIYGKPYDINIELGRDVGMSTKKKKEFENRQKQNEKLNEEAKNYLKEHKIAINNKNILKYKLAKEQGWKDAYNPTQNISSVFTGMEIEHIIPQAKGGTDTYNNLCLVNCNDNLNKSDRYAYEYFEETKTQEEIREILKNARSRTPEKSWRFEADAREKYEESGDKEESTRYLTDMAEGKKEIKITEGRILLKAFRIIQDKGLWKGDKFRCYSNSSSMINIPKHGVAYEAQNNHCVDFYQKNGKIGWEVIKRFDVNQTDFEPQWKKEGGKIIWSVQQGDILELDTPDEWKQYTDKERCLAKVKKFSDGKIAIDFITDARMTSPKNKELKYMFVNTISDKGLTYLINHKTRKVELTPFGKIKKKHKVLWNGTKTAA